MFTTTTSKILTIRQGEDGFNIKDGMILYPRAMLHVLPDCPNSVRQQINWAMNNGYIKCVAHIYEHEQTYNLLKENSNDM